MDAMTPKSLPQPQWRHPTAYCCWGDEERAAIERVIDSNWFTMGPEVAAFEREFAAYHGRRYGIMVNSGSSANLVAVAALTHVPKRPLRRGDKALVPALAWSTTYAPLVQHGLDLVLCDVDDTWNADPAKANFRDCRLVVGCSVLGSPARLEDFAAIANDAGAWFLEDNCESIGAVTGQGRPCGTIGDVSTFSFFWSHQIGAVEGGMILTDNGQLDRLCRMLRSNGWSRDVEPQTTLESEYDFQLFGYNFRPVEMHAAIAREQLKKLPGMVEVRQRNLDNFRIAVHGLQVTVQQSRGAPSPFGLPFEVNDPEARPRVAEALRGHGIDRRMPAGGSFRLHAYGAPWRDQQTPRADYVHRRGLFLWNAAFDMTEEIGIVADVLREALR